MSLVDRNLNLLDAMILTAASAIGISGAMLIWHSPNLINFTNNQVYPQGVSDLPWSFYYTYNWLFILSPLGFSWTVCLALLALRRPLPDLRQLADRPGVAACWAATFAMLISWSLSAWDQYTFGNFQWEILLRIREDDFPDITFPTVLDMIISESFRPIACSVFSVWAIMIIGKRWSLGANWMNRAGTCLGLMWIIFEFLEVVERPR